jgi:hypothetical protein
MNNTVMLGNAHVNKLSDLKNKETLIKRLPIVNGIIHTKNIIVLTQAKNLSFFFHHMNGMVKNDANIIDKITPSRNDGTLISTGLVNSPIIINNIITDMIVAITFATILNTLTIKGLLE